jgi:hypothetical protein
MMVDGLVIKHHADAKQKWIGETAYDQGQRPFSMHGQFRSQSNG